MVLFETLAEFLTKLEEDPGEIIAHPNGQSCSVYIPETNEYLFLDGNFSGTDEENKVELARLLKEMGYPDGG